MVRYNPLTNQIIKAASRAAVPLLRDFGEIEKLQAKRKGPSDFVSIAYKRTEEMIVEDLEKAYAHFDFMLEGKGIKQGNTDVFVISPLDGMTNFFNGIPHFAISIAAKQKNETVSAIILDVANNELFIAEKGRGAFMNNQRLRVSGRNQIKDSIFGSYIPVYGSSTPEYEEKFINQYTKITRDSAGVRNMGAASLDLAYVAAGRFDGFWQYGSEICRVAAGISLVSEAGGLITNFKGGFDVSKSSEIVASNPHIHQDFLNLL